jgi:hypothetical protein
MQSKEASTFIFSSELTVTEALRTIPSAETSTSKFFMAPTKLGPLITVSKSTMLSAGTHLNNFNNFNYKKYKQPLNIGPNIFKIYNLFSLLPSINPK